jgi:hypothetical protein
MSAQFLCLEGKIAVVQEAPGNWSRQEARHRDVAPGKVAYVVTSFAIRLHANTVVGALEMNPLGADVQCAPGNLAASRQAIAMHEGAISDRDVATRIVRCTDCAVWLCAKPRSVYAWVCRSICRSDRMRRIMTRTSCKLRLSYSIEASARAIWSRCTIREGTPIC